MQFLSEKFSLNGISSDSMGVILITLDDDVLRDFGNIYNNDLSVDANFNNTPFYSDNITKDKDMVLNIMLVEKDEITPAEWDVSTISMVCDWLISDNFQPFISYDNSNIVYYIKCTNIDKKFTNDMKGYLECTFKIFDNNAYYRSNTFLNVVGSESVNIVNVSDYDSEYKPVVKITNNDTSNIIISSNDREMVISDLGVGDTIIIDNKMKTVADINGENKLSNCNREWISLYPGSNTLRVNGNCQVEIISEFPIRV